MVANSRNRIITAVQAGQFLSTEDGERSDRVTGEYRRGEGIKIYNHIDRPFTGYADVNMMKTVLRNLLSNAIKFSYTGGRD